MVSSRCVGASIRNLFIVLQSALFLCGIFLEQVESFDFIDNSKPVDGVVIEITGTTNYTISCQTDDLKAVTTLWFNDNELSVGGRISLENQNYTIHGLKMSDRGTYMCKATSSQGTETRAKSISLLLMEERIPCCPKVFPQTKFNMEVGSSEDFLCHVDVQTYNALEKYLTFKWYKKVGNTFVEVSDSDTFRYNRSISVLKIRNAQATPKGGNLYKCEMIYRGSTSFFDGPRVVVHNITAATISGLPAVVAGNESSKLTVECKAEGYPVPVIKWLQNGTQVAVCLKTDNDDCTGKNYQVLEHKNEQWAYMISILIIKSAKYPRDHGRYTCMASNSQTAQKDVQISVQIPPMLDKTLTLSVKRKIYCKIIRSNPLPTFKWQFQRGLCLNVDYECKPSPSRWTDITADFVVSPAVAMATNKSTITIPQNALSGFVRCNATNKLGTDAHSMGFLAYENDEEVKMTAATMEYDEGQSLRLQCFMPWKGSVISWYRSGQRLTRATDARVNITWSVESDRTWTTLTVERLMTNDSGVYACEAQQNGTGKHLNTSKFIKISKVYPPAILSFRNQSVYQEKTVRLQCNITAHPTPTVKWFKDGDSLEHQIREQPKSESCERFSKGVLYRVQGIVGLLVICQPSHALHTGFYTCQASNAEGNSSATAFLDVLEDPVIVSPNKELTYQPVRVKLGKPWNATCKATGNPVPAVEWIREKDNKSVNLKLHDGQGVLLNIASVGQDDLGTYDCVAENSKARTTESIKLVSDGPLPDTAAGGLSKQATIGISVVGGALFIFVVLGITCCVFIRHQRKQIREYRSQFLGEFFGEYQIDPDRTLLEQCNNLQYDPDWEFPEDRLILGDVLGAGAFGQVIKAEAIGIADFHPRDKSVERVRRRSKMFRRSSSSKVYHNSHGMPYMKTIVAVKTLKANATRDEYRDLASELKILIHVGEHTNIINLLGACTRGKGDRLLVILEYAPHGSLLKFLKGKRDIYEPTWAKTINNPELEFTIAYLVLYAYQICRGMEFLASRKCVHRDLAARNVLVGVDYVIKVADFGLARDVYKSDLYVKTGGGVLPIKWMALESLYRKEYSEKSDVWSFGICLWEIFTLGGSPYPGIPTEQLLDFLSDGHRMQQPQNCPSEIYDIMMDCWQTEPERRPTFGELGERIYKIIERRASEQDSSGYICLMEDDKRNRSDYYVAPAESGPSNLHGGAAGYSRQSSEDLVQSPLPPLPLGTERELEQDERERMLEPEANGSFSENESGIDLEEAGNEMAAGVELRHVARPKGKARKTLKSEETFV